MSSAPSIADAAPPGRAPARPRQSVAIESILSAGADPTLIGRMARPLLSVLPGRGRLGWTLAAAVALEVAMFFAVSLLGKTALARLAGDAPEGPGALIAAGLAATAALFAALAWRRTLQERVSARWRSAMVARLGRNIGSARYEDLASVPMAGLREILLTDAPFLARFYVEAGASVLVVLLWLVALAAFLAWRAAALALAVGAVLVVFALVLGAVLRRHMRLTAERFRRQAALSERARDLCELDRTVALRQFGLGGTMAGRFEAAHERAVAVNLDQQRLAQVGRAALIALNGAGFLALAFAGSALIGRGALGAGDLFAALFLALQLFAALSQLGDLTGQAAEAMTAARRLGLYWDDAEEGRSPAASPGRIRRIEARGVSFGYRGQPPALSDVSLTLEPGITALTAATGAGKTTLALLISGLLEPERGRVTVNGAVPAHDLAPGRVLYVGSKPVLFDGTLRDNLFHEGDASAAAPVLRHLRRDGRPVDLDAPLVGAGGAGLSSGQAQLVQLARAVLREPEAVVFDEATSALDMGTEAAVQEALLGWCRARTTLVVSHRRCPWLDEADREVTW